MTRPIHVHDQQVYTSAVGEVLFYDSCNANRDNKETLRQLTVHAVRLYTHKTHKTHGRQPGSYSYQQTVHLK